MDFNYTKLCSLIQKLGLTGNETFEMDFNSHLTDVRTKSIKSLLASESIYLIKINTLLTTMFIHLEKNLSNIFRSHNISKEQFVHLFHCFPTIYNLHVNFYNNIKNEKESIQMIGNVIYEFLSQTELLKIYERYVSGISNSLLICKLIQSKSDEKQNVLNGIEEIIKSPIKRFTKLSAAINKLSWNTPTKSADKINIFKSLQISKYFKVRLNQLYIDQEHKGMESISSIAIKFKRTILSTKTLRIEKVYDLVSNSFFPQKLLKIPYCLILCDQDLIMIPQNLSLNGLPSLGGSLSNIESDLYQLTTFAHRNCEKCNVETFSEDDSPLFPGVIAKVSNLYLSIEGTRINDPLFNSYSKLIHDYHILKDVMTDLKQLNFPYNVVDIMTIQSSLLNLEHQLKGKERQLNKRMSSILIFKCTVSDVIKEERFILFNSSEVAKEWQISVNRQKILKDIKIHENWLHNSSNTNFQRLTINELPFIFPAFSPPTNIFKNTESIIIKCEPVSIVLKGRLYRALLIYLANNCVIITHYNYEQWTMLDSFQVEASLQMEDMCNIVLFEPNTETVINSELWIAFGNQIFVYTLLNVRCTELKYKINLSSNIKSFCQMEDKILVTLKPHVIVIFGIDSYSKWSIEKKISLNTLVDLTDEMKQIVYTNNIVYACLEMKILIFERNVTDLLTLKSVFKSDVKISAFTTTLNGAWISLDGQNSILLFGKFIDITIQTISLNSNILGLPSLGNVTAIHANKRYIWIGTENGLIICISSMDSLYCVDSSIPFYLCSAFSSGPITQIFPFQNSKSVSIRKHIEKVSRGNIQSNLRARKGGCLQRSNSCPIISDLDNICGPRHDRLCKHCLNDAYKQSNSDIMTSIIAIGSGITKCDDFDVKTDSYSRLKTFNDGQSTIFTFLE